MKHFRDYAPDAALPNYSGIYLTWQTNSFVFEHASVKFDVMLNIDCVGTDNGQFEPVDSTVWVKTPDMDAYVAWPLIFGATRRREHKPPMMPIAASLCEALEKRWDREVDAELVEKAEEEL